LQPRRGARALILSPTRELAVQISDDFRNYGKFMHVRQTVIFGGVGQNPQVADLRRGVDIIIATPGRLLDLMEQGYVDLRTSKCSFLTKPTACSTWASSRHPQGRLATPSEKADAALQCNHAERDSRPC